MNPDGIRKGKIMKAAVKVKNLTKSFGKEKVLKGISHTFEAGKIHGIMGFNGSGKTVMFKCICGFLQPDRGSVYVYGKEIGKILISGKYRNDYRESGISSIYQWI